VSRLSSLKSAYLSLLSKPAHERLLYRLIRHQRPKRIVELGVGKAVRSQRMLQMASRFVSANEIQYVGVDLFEPREDKSSGLHLKEAHRLLKLTRASVRLIPGDPLSALSRAANSLQRTDLFVIGADQDERSLELAWFYVPRMLHGDSLVVREDLGGVGPTFRIVANDDIRQLSDDNASGRRAA